MSQCDIIPNCSIASTQFFTYQITHLPLNYINFLRFTDVTVGDIIEASNINTRGNESKRKFMHIQSATLRSAYITSEQIKFLIKATVFISRRRALTFECDVRYIYRTSPVIRSSITITVGNRILPALQEDRAE